MSAAQAELETAIGLLVMLKTRLHRMGICESGRLGDIELALNFELGAHESKTNIQIEASAN